MDEAILIGHDRHFTTVRRSEWERELQAAPAHIRRRLEFMSPEHHAVRNFVVTELPRVGRPLSIEDISDRLQLSGERVLQIVDDLEENRFFLVRRDGPEVSWAFPVTVDQTVHKLFFGSGERLDGA